MVGLEGRDKNQALCAPVRPVQLISPSSRKLVGGASTGDAVGFAGSQYGPDDPCILIGDRHRRAVEAAPLSKLVDPLVSGVGAVRGCPHHRSRAVDEQAAQMLAPVCTENVVRIELVMESGHAWGDDHADFLAPNLLAALVKSKIRLEAENAALRQQLIVLQRKMRGRARFSNGDMIARISLHLNLVAAFFKSKSRLEAENAELRQQLIVLQGKFRGRVAAVDDPRWSCRKLAASAASLRAFSCAV